MTKTRIDAIVSQVMDKFNSDEAAKQEHLKTLTMGIKHNEDRIQSPEQLAKFSYLWGLQAGAKMGIDAILRNIAEGHNEQQSVTAI